MAHRRMRSVVLAVAFVSFTSLTGGGFVSFLRDVFAGVLEKRGSGLDPDGSTTDSGSSLDPNGRS